MISKPWQPRDNTDGGAKIDMRKLILSNITTPSVLDCFAGEGKIWTQCYKDMPYVGLDRKAISDGRTVLNIDNIKYLRSADLTRFNVFDLDAYGSPWHQFMIVLKRRKLKADERVAIFLTDGLSILTRLGNLPTGMKKYVGIPAKMRVPCLSRHMDYIRALVVVNAVREAGAGIERALITRNSRGNMVYMGLLIKKT
ncbi:MAG TPA: hypothetical protein DCP24_12760 [Nitrospiraceae bacterium]|nr:hypothetical protein [Nitrospiraceae bacterium]